LPNRQRSAAVARSSVDSKHSEKCFEVKNEKEFSHFSSFETDTFNEFEYFIDAGNCFGAKVGAL
jgi:hypothetical protein